MSYYSNKYSQINLVVSLDFTPPHKSRLLPPKIHQGNKKNGENITVAWIRKPNNKKKSIKWGQKNTFFTCNAIGKVKGNFLNKEMAEGRNIKRGIFLIPNKKNKKENENGEL